MVCAGCQSENDSAYKRHHFLASLPLHPNSQSSVTGTPSSWRSLCSGELTPSGPIVSTADPAARLSGSKALHRHWGPSTHKMQVRRMIIRRVHHATSAMSAIRPPPGLLRYNQGQHRVHMGRIAHELDVLDSTRGVHLRSDEALHNWTTDPLQPSPGRTDWVLCIA